MWMCWWSWTRGSVWGRGEKSGFRLLHADDFAFGALPFAVAVVEVAFELFHFDFAFFAGHCGLDTVER
jgi:hypothetical protein